MLTRSPMVTRCVAEIAVPKLIRPPEPIAICPTGPVRSSQGTNVEFRIKSSPMRMHPRLLICGRPMARALAPTRSQALKYQGASARANTYRHALAARADNGRSGSCVTRLRKDSSIDCLVPPGDSVEQSPSLRGRSEHVIGPSQHVDVDSVPRHPAAQRFKELRPAVV